MTPARTAAPHSTSALSSPSCSAEALREAQGQPGVLVRDLRISTPMPSSAELAGLIAARTIDLRIAYLNPDGAASAAPRRHLRDVFSTEVEACRDVAQRPRPRRAHRGHHRGGCRQADLARRLRRHRAGATARGYSSSGRPLAVRVRSTRCCRGGGRSSARTSRSRSSTSSTTTSRSAPLRPEDVRDQARRQINRLGLLPDPGFFDNPGEKQLRSTA